MASMIPFSLEAEEAVVASLLIDPSALGDVSMLRVSDFHDERCRAAYKACLSCDTINQLSVAEVMERQGHPNMEAYLSKVIAETPSSLYARQYAEIVAEKAYQRRVIEAAGEMAQIGYKGGEDLYEKLRRLIDGLQPRQHEAIVYGPQELAEAVMSISSDWQEHRQAVQFGYENFDRATGGMNGGELVIVGARTSVGKSQILEEIAMHNVNTGRCVLFASLEMSLRQLLERQIVSRLRKDIVSLRNGRATAQDWKSIGDLAQELATKHFHVTSTTLTLEAITARARNLKESSDLALVCFDHVQFAAKRLGKGYGDSLREKVGYVTAWAKTLAMDLGIPVLAACQLNRMVENRDGHRPMLADLQESGSIEQDADLVLLLHRPEMYEKCKPEDKGIMQVKIAKDRQGGKDDVLRLRWDPKARQYGPEVTPD